MTAPIVTLSGPITEGATVTHKRYGGLMRVTAIYRSPGYNGYEAAYTDIDTGARSVVHTDSLRLAERAQKPGDEITARIFGRYLTLQRCEWEQMGTMSGEDGERCREIARRDASTPWELTPESLGV